MEAGIFDIHADHGSDLVLEFQYKESNDTFVNLTGDVISFYVKKSILPYEVFFSIHSNGTTIEGDLPFPTSDLGYGTMTVNNGTITLVINRETMSQLQPMNYFYTLVRSTEDTDLGTLDTVILKGKFAVEAA